MALYKIDDYDPDYQHHFFDGNDIKGNSVYALNSNGHEEKVGSVDNLLVSADGYIRYFVIDTGFWIFGKKVLLPVGRSIDDPERDRIYVSGLTKEQVTDLPDYSDANVVDSSYEDRVRSIYRMQPVGHSTAVEMSVPVEQSGIKGYASPPVASRPAPAPVAASVQPPSGEYKPEYAYNDDQDLYGTNEQNQRRLRLYEERLVADKSRQKTGAVTISKRIETEQSELSVPVQKEKIVIEVESVVGGTRVNVPDDSFKDGTVTRIDVHEERANIHKEAVVHQEINIRKEIEVDTVTAHETLRREELEIQNKGNPDVIDRR